MSALTNEQVRSLLCVLDDYEATAYGWSIGIDGGTDPYEEERAEIRDLELALIALLKEDR